MGSRREEWIILVAVFLDLLGFGMIIANIQLRAEALVPAHWPAGLVIGLLLASTFVVQLIVSPHWGRYSDVRGRKPVVVLCTLLSGGAMVLYGFADSIWILLVSRILSGLGAANVAVAQAFISDRYDGEQRTAALGRIGAAITAGLVVGPPLGGLLAFDGAGSRQATIVGLVAGGASLLGVALMFLLLPDIRPKEERTPGKRPVVDFTLLRDFPKLVPLVMIAIVAWFSLATLEGTFARLISHLFGYKPLHFGILFGYESLLGVIVQGVLLGWIAKRWKDRRILLTAYVLQGVGLALNPASLPLSPFLHPMATLVIASTLYAIGAGVANPTINSLCSRLVPEDRSGELFGLLQGTRSFGFVVGPMLGGILFDWHPSAPYLVAGAVCGTAALLISRAIPEEQRVGGIGEA